MTARAKKAPTGVTIPMPLISAVVTIALAAIAGLVALNVQITTVKEQNASMKERIDFLYQIEMQRYPRAGPPAKEE